MKVKLIDRGRFTALLLKNNNNLNPSNNSSAVEIVFVTEQSWESYPLSELCDGYWCITNVYLKLFCSFYQAEISNFGPKYE